MVLGLASAVSESSDLQCLVPTKMVDFEQVNI